MTREPEINYYELFDIPPGATGAEIEEAYKQALSLYGDDNVATYSLYSPEERKAMLQRINKAYETLRDPVKRESYDTNQAASDQNNNHGKDLLQAVKGDMFRIERNTQAEDSNNNTKLKQPLVVLDDTDPIAAEQYRVLYTRLEQISAQNSYKVFAITSAVKGEGKTMTSLNLAQLAVKEFGKKTILVECDLKNPSISFNHLNTLKKHGLVDVLKGEVEPLKAMAQLNEDGLYLLPAVRSVKNSSGLLGSRRMSSLINALKTEFDYVILDTPPILPLADMNILSGLADGLLMVVRAGKTPKDVVTRAINSLHGANVVGIVLNGTDPAFDKYYGSYAY
ncbi:MAG: hypothetical protein IEMM0002_1464 [bacterium]|nr:MAG: hypothetical protein IEMM0002_1464 [bacterium]